MNIKNRESKYFSKAVNRFYIGGSGQKRMPKNTQSMPFMMAKNKKKPNRKLRFILILTTIIDKNLVSRAQNLLMDKASTQKAVEKPISKRPRREHSASQNYKTVQSAVSRPRYDSVSSMRSERPSFKKLEQITCNDDPEEISPERSPKQTKQRHFSMNGRNSRKLNKQYNSCTEKPRLPSAHDAKWDQALKKQK